MLAQPLQCCVPLQTSLAYLCIHSHYSHRLRTSVVDKESLRRRGLSVALPLLAQFALAPPLLRLLGVCAILQSPVRCSANREASKRQARKEPELS